MNLFESILQLLANPSFHGLMLLCIAVTLGVWAIFYLFISNKTEAKKEDFADENILNVGLSVLQQIVALSKKNKLRPDNLGLLSEQYVAENSASLFGDNTERLKCFLNAIFVQIKSMVEESKLIDVVVEFVADTIMDFVDKIGFLDRLFDRLNITEEELVKFLQNLADRKGWANTTGEAKTIKELSRNIVTTGMKEDKEE